MPPKRLGLGLSRLQKRQSANDQVGLAQLNLLCFVMLGPLPSLAKTY